MSIVKINLSINQFYHNQWRRKHFCFRGGLSSVSPGRAKHGLAQGGDFENPVDGLKSH